MLYGFPNVLGKVLGAESFEHCDRISVKQPRVSVQSAAEIVRLMFSQQPHFPGRG